MLLDKLRRDTDDVLTLPVLHHVESLQRADDVCLGDTRHPTVSSAHNLQFQNHTNHSKIVSSVAHNQPKLVIISITFAESGVFNMGTSRT